MGKCPECKSNSRIRRVTAHICMECGFIALHTGLEELLRDIGIAEETIDEVMIQITATNVAAALLS